MGMRPPSDDTEEPEAIEFGIAAVDARLDRGGVTFPASREEVLTTLGDQSIPYDASGTTVSLSTALDEAGKSHFENEQEFLNALHPVFEEYRSSRAGGILRQMRSLLPF